MSTFDVASAPPADWYEGDAATLRGHLDRVGAQLAAAGEDSRHAGNLLYLQRLMRQRLAELDPARLTDAELGTEIARLGEAMHAEGQHLAARPSPGDVAHRDHLHRLWHRLRAERERRLVAAGEGRN